MALTRREFLSYAPAALVARELPIPVPSRERGDYSFIVLGDVHFDGPEIETYHANYVDPEDPEKAASYRTEFERTVGMWEYYMPILMKNAATQVRSDTAFVLQMGDLIQGDSGTTAVHRRMATDAYNTVKKAFGGKLPLYVTCGNHDIRLNGGTSTTGAASTYYACMSRLMSAEEGLTIDDSSSARMNYSFMRGPDLFIFANFNQTHSSIKTANSAISSIRSALKAHPEARYRFLVTHGPVLPSDCDNWYWGMCLSNKNTDEDQAPRRELLNLLLAYDVIVLAGHTHTTELTEVATDAGRVTQIITNSVYRWMANAWGSAMWDQPSEYGCRQTASLPKRIFAEYIPAMTRYWRSNIACHMRFDVSSQGVTARMCRADSTTPYQVWRIR